VIAGFNVPTRLDYRAGVHSNGTLRWMCERTTISILVALSGVHDMYARGSSKLSDVTESIL
jgi:hypothetical protein